MASIETIRRYVNDPTGIIYPDAYLFDTMNDCLLDMFIDCKPETLSATLTINTGDDIIYIPNHIMIPQQVIYQNKPYYITTQAELERWERKWRSSTPAQPRWFIRWDARRIRIWPRADATYDMTMWGIGWPTEIDDSADTLMDDPDWKQAIEHKTASQLLEMARPDLADLHEREYKESRNDFNISKRNSNGGHNIMQLRPATRNNHSQLGSIQVGRWYK